MQSGVVVVTIVAAVAVTFCRAVPVAVGLNCCLMLRCFLCNWTLQSGRLKNNEAPSQLDVNYLLVVLDISFEVRQN